MNIPLRGIHLSGPGTRCRAYKRPETGQIVVHRTGHAAKSAQMNTPDPTYVERGRHDAPISRRAECQTMMTTAPYGSWSSPITAADVARGNHPVESGCFVGDELWWSELRPSEGGRYAVRRPGADGRRSDRPPTGAVRTTTARPPRNTRSRLGGCRGRRPLR